MIEWTEFEAIQGVLDSIRPILQIDGMDVELIDVQGNIVCVRLTGLDPRCVAAPLMLQAGLEEALGRNMRGFGGLKLILEYASVESSLTA